MYYLILIKTYSDGTADKKSLYTYATFDEGLSSFHSQLGAIGGDGVASVMCKLITYAGTELRTEYWSAETTTDTTEEEETTEDTTTSDATTDTTTEETTAEE